MRLEFTYLLAGAIYAASHEFKFSLPFEKPYH